MKELITVFVLLFLIPVTAQNVLSEDIQINMAVSAAPEMYKKDATVIGYNKEGKLVTLRKGSNHMVCLADDPSKEGISIACYGKELEPFMARGRELIAEGKSEKEKREIRQKEFEEGKLKMPEEVTMVYVLTADEEDLDRKTGEFSTSYIRYVFYKPYMTTESTGLPDKPQAAGMPWLMDAGTHRSHIMITPPRP